MDPGQQVKTESDLFESSDEEVRRMVHEEFQDYFDVQEEVVVQECPEQEIITQNWDLNNSTDIDT